MKNVSMNCLPPPQTGRPLLTRLSVMFCKTAFYLALIFMIFGNSIYTNAQTPIIDCSNNFTCQNEPWVDYNWYAYQKNGCIVNPLFRISKCCNGSECEYVVDLKRIIIHGDCSQSISEMEEQDIPLGEMNLIFSKKSKSLHFI